MCRRQRNHGFAPAEEPGQEVGLVIVRVHDIDLALAHYPPQRRPDRPIERIALDHLDVVEAELGGATIEREHLIALVTDVADGRRNPGGIEQTGAGQDRLVRPASRAPYAAE